MVTAFETRDFRFDLSETPTSPAQREALLRELSFGRVFTDHMALIAYDEKKGGWHDARILARQPITLDPAACVLHYGQEIFEGLKAFRRTDGKIAVFRPEENAQRFVASAQRMAMAVLPEPLFLAAIDALISVDGAWVPQGESESLYLRPFMIATEAFLGVKPASQYLFGILAAPVGSYFKAACVSVWVSDDYVRAAPGGTGAAKCGGNYAASLLAQEEARKQQCDQVLFLDSREGRFVEEMGGMNVMFVQDGDTLITPPLLGTILPGITRQSLMTLAKDCGMRVREEAIDINDVFAGAQSGRLSEAFACGTAAAISPIGKLHRSRGNVTFGDGQNPGPVALKLKKALTDIQWGRVTDPYGWMHHCA